MNNQVLNNFQKEEDTFPELTNQIGGKLSGNRRGEIFRFDDDDDEVANSSGKYERNLQDEENPGPKKGRNFRLDSAPVLSQVEKPDPKTPQIEEGGGDEPPKTDQKATAKVHLGLKCSASSRDLEFDQVDKILASFSHLVTARDLDSLLISLAKSTLLANPHTFQTILIISSLFLALVVSSAYIFYSILAVLSSNQSMLFKAIEVSVLVSLIILECCGLRRQLRSCRKAQNLFFVERRKDFQKILNSFNYKKNWIAEKGVALTAGEGGLYLMFEIFDAPEKSKKTRKNHKKNRIRIEKEKESRYGEYKEDSEKPVFQFKFAESRIEGLEEQEGSKPYRNKRSSQRVRVTFNNEFAFLDRRFPSGVGSKISQRNKVKKKKKRRRKKALRDRSKSKDKKDLNLKSVNRESGKFNQPIDFKNSKESLSDEKSLIVKEQENSDVGSFGSIKSAPNRGMVERQGRGDAQPEGDDWILNSKLSNFPAEMRKYSGSGAARRRFQTVPRRLLAADEGPQAPPNTSYSKKTSPEDGKTNLSKAKERDLRASNRLGSYESRHGTEGRDRGAGTERKEGKVNSVNSAPSPAVSGEELKVSYFGEDLLDSKFN